MLYEDKMKENQQLRDKLDSIQQIQTAMLAYVLSQNQAGYGFGPQKKDTPQNSMVSSFPQMLLSMFGSPF